MPVSDLACSRLEPCRMHLSRDMLELEFPEEVSPEKKPTLCERLTRAGLMVSKPRYYRRGR